MKEWDSIWRGKKELTDYELKWYNFLKKFSNARSILEVGCGSGRGLKVFNNFTVGLDKSTESIRLAKIGSCVKYLILGDAMHIPLKEKSIEVVISSGLIEHFKKMRGDQKILNEMVRVLKKNGKIIVSVPNSSCFWYVLIKFIMTMFKKWPYPNEDSYTRSELKSIFKKLELRKIKMMGLQLFPPSHDGFRKIYPKRLTIIFDKTEKKIGKLNSLLAYAVVGIGEKFS